jgi:hypothetical protein
MTNKPILLIAILPTPPLHLDVVDPEHGWPPSITIIIMVEVFEIQSSYNIDYCDCFLLRCDVMQSGRCLQLIQRNTLLHSSDMRVIAD